MSAPFQLSRRWPLAALAALVLTLPALSARAQVVDGYLDAAYGPPLVTQTTQTSFFDATNGSLPGYSTGSELDAAYGFISGGVLHLFFAGNVAFCCPQMYSQEQEIEIFLDSGPGGQNVLRADNTADLGTLSGLTFDADFSPDYYFGCIPAWSMTYAALPTSSGGTMSSLGTLGYSAPGTLSGTNPYGVTAALMDTNTAGVTHGCGAASGAGVTTGLELAIPLAAIGNPTGCIKVCAFIAGPDNTTGQFVVSNQVIGPVPPGTCALGVPSSVNFASIPGSQYVSICTGATPTHDSTWGALKAIYR